MPKVFISYCHVDGEFIWRRLVPTLKAAGAEILIDVERFALGIGCEQQMDAAQDSADFQLLCFSRDYLMSDSCSHEWQRALATDPMFESGKVVPLTIEEGLELPHAFKHASPLQTNLLSLDDSRPWQLLMRSLNLKPPWCPLRWQVIGEEIAASMNRMKSVNLIVENRVEAVSLLQNLQTRQLPSTLVPNLKRVSLADLRCVSCEGFLTAILEQIQVRHRLPKQKLKAVVEFGRIMAKQDRVFMALENFDMAADRDRQKEYGNNIFAGFFDLTQKRKLSLLVVSRQSYASLLPPSHPVSAIPFETFALNRMQ